MIGMREKLIELLCKAQSMSAEAACFEDATYAQQLEMEADSLIANGVTIPVRCKDCKHFVPFVEPYDKAGMCNRKMLGLIAEEDFCSYGKRRTDDD